MRRLSLLLITCALAGCRTVSVAEVHPKPTYTVRDLTPTFWRFWAEAQHQSEAEQVALFEAQVVRAHPEVYTAGVLGLNADKPLTDELKTRWPKFLAFAGAQLPLARELSKSIGVDLPRYDASFREAFPDFAYAGEVYFLISLGGFDGGLRQVRGKMALLFGLDIIAAIYGADANPKAFFDHELFHLYQQQFPDPELEGTLAWALWHEGLAEYVADQLNPHTPEAVLLGLPRDTPTRVRADLPVIAREFRSRLGSKSSEDYERYFLGSDANQSPPARSGYTLGFLVVKRVAAGRTLAELARLKGSALREEIDAALKQFGGEP